VRQLPCIAPELTYDQADNSRGLLDLQIESAETDVPSDGLLPCGGRCQLKVSAQAVPPRQFRGMLDQPFCNSGPNQICHPSRAPEEHEAYSRKGLARGRRSHDTAGCDRPQVSQRGFAVGMAIRVPGQQQLF